MALKDTTKKMIAEQIPNFDFEKDRTRGEVASVTRVAFKLSVRRGKVKRFETVISLGFAPGVTVENTAGLKETVKKVSKSGHLILEGKKGAFNADFWQVVRG